jgi:hypothetical protein
MKSETKQAWRNLFLDTLFCLTFVLVAFLVARHDRREFREIPPSMSVEEVSIESDQDEIAMLDRPPESEEYMKGLLLSQ